MQVGDLARSLDFYQQVIGLRVTDRSRGQALLSPNDTTAPLVELHERAGARAATHRGNLGLFHFAILLPDRAALGRFAQHLAGVRVRVGSADHLVSEAFYLQDPDNLGIEVYADLPRSNWRRNGRQLLMATDPLDIADLVRAGGGTSWSGMPAGTTMGHMHLHVGDIARANDFYSDALGFDRVVWQYPGALFMSAGGYHHHLGTNTWAGPDATSPGPDDAQLLDWSLVLPDEPSVSALIGHLAERGVPTERSNDGEGYIARDPWGTAVRLSVDRERPDAGS